MNNVPAINYYPLTDYPNLFVLDNISNAIKDKLDKGNIEAIVKAFYSNTIIGSNGIPFIKVDGISTILRTGNSGLERALIYQGIPNYLSKAEVVSINGDDYISGHHLFSLLDARISIRRGKTKQYLKISFDLYHQIVNSNHIADLREIFIDEIESGRSALKRKRIETYEINQCEFTGTMFDSYTEVQFAHIDSVVYNPSLALDINNGVIILISIHSDMTRRGINTYEETFQYCQEKGYKLNWAD